MSDIVKDLTEYRIRGIEKAEVEFYESLTRTLDKIEDEIVALADTNLPRQAGKLIELQSAVAIRPKIKAILDKEYLPFADRVVRKGFGEQAKRVERQFKTIGIIPPEFQELTKGDLALVKNLKQQYYTQFKDVSNNFTRILSDKVYQNTLVGTEFTVLEKELRESINGIYASSRDPAVNRLVSYVKRNRDNPRLKGRVDSAIKQLQSKYARTRTGENMKRYAGQILNDSLRDFDATLNFNKSKDAGLTFVKYYGDVIPTTRDLCRRMVSGQLNKRKNGLFTIAEIQDIWAGRSWSGKKGGNPMVVRGGYNCRHQFSYVNPDWYEEDGEESSLLTGKEKPTAVPNPSKSIFGETSKDEKILLEKAFGTEPSSFSKAIAFIPALKTLQKSGRGFYRRSDDTLNIGSNRIGVAEEMKVFIHEYTHRIDRIIGLRLSEEADKVLLNKFAKGVSTDVTNNSRFFASISHLKVQSLIDDTKVLTKGLKKRRLGFNDEWAKVTAKQPSIFEKAKLEKYYEKLNKELKVVLTDNEIKTYLTSNGRTASQAGIYKFKLKLKNKILAPRYDGGFDLQFSGDFNDYIGAITKETIGGGHGKSYYSKYSTILRDGTRTFTEGQTLEAWANHSAMTMNPNIIDNKNVKEIERKLMKYFTPNTTKAFDDVVNDFNNL
tara:strand:+ start:89 stop:2077 length:1989 start_codon:yes stop_codon:yes gene_type:complete